MPTTLLYVDTINVEMLWNIMCTVNVVAQAIFFMLILSGLTYSIGSGFLVTDHLLDVNPCYAYASDDCAEYACQNYTSGAECPCYVDEHECQYKESSEYPLMPKACKALQNVDGSDLYERGVEFTALIFLSSVLVLGKLLSGLFACPVCGGHGIAEGITFLLTLVDLIFVGASYVIIWYIHTKGVNTCYSENFPIGSERDDESVEFNTKFWVIMISGAIDIVLSVIFVILYGSNLDVHLFHHGQALHDEPDSISMIGDEYDEDARGRFAKKKILYKF